MPTQPGPVGLLEVDTGPGHSQVKEQSVGFGDGYHVPLINEQDVIISGPFPISEANWQHMLHVLEVMKAGLVSSEPNGE